MLLKSVNTTYIHCFLAPIGRMFQRATCFCFLLVLVVNISANVSDLGIEMFKEG